LIGGEGSNLLDTQLLYFFSGVNAARASSEIKRISVTLILLTAETERLEISVAL